MHVIILLNGILKLQKKSHKLTPFHLYLRQFCFPIHCTSLHSISLQLCSHFILINIDSENHEINFASNEHFIEQVCLEVSGGAWFESQLGHWLSWLKFLGFPQSFQANAKVVPHLGHDHFHPNPVHHLSVFIPSDIVESQYWKHIINHPTEEKNKPLGWST
jgi:hypothetical protein